MTPRRTYPVDIRGNELSPGTVVAYNYSGDVAIGIIMEVKQGKQYNRQIDIFKIEARTHGGGVSTVRNNRSLIAIDGENFK